MINFHILTIFPEIFESPLNHSLISKAVEKGLLKFNFYNIRDYTTDKHNTVDDSPYGGGAGMVMKVEPIVAAIRDVEGKVGKCHKVLMSPRGHLFNNERAVELATHENILILCGRYEGIDERIHLHFMDEVLSIGDYILTGGEIPALAVIEATSRFIPGVVGKGESVERDSFSNKILCHPQYTRPVEFEGMKVPDILMQGNHKKIDEWRAERALETTRTFRPDLLDD